MCLPEFTEDGLLPPGTYQLTIQELRDSRLVTGLSSIFQDNWDREWRSQLIDNLEILISFLWKGGIKEVFIDGSFVEDKSHPNDIDGYFNCTLAEYEKITSTCTILDLSQRIKRKPIMWFEYKVELYPNWNQASGIKDEFGYDQPFPSAFRRSREGQEKGIIQIVKEKKS
ncbi:MAG: hypothetical protein QNJ31_09280 [Candidatus Caenarcaniphilales bacterium]|nr:hypothetical protein [Candidatus Caenarcaniphilales bacterium]